MAGGYTALTPFSIASSLGDVFQYGTNVVTFIVRNDKQDGDNPTVLVDGITSSFTAVVEASSFLVVGL